MSPAIATQRQLLSADLSFFGPRPDPTPRGETTPTWRGWRVFMIDPFSVIGNVDGDGLVGITDFLMLLANWS